MARHFLRLFVLLSPMALSAQFYNGAFQEYGKNRVQYQDFLWQSYRFDRYEIYFYKGGRDIARYVAVSASRNLREVEQLFDHTVDDRIQFVVYTSLTDFRQSNIGVTGDEAFNIGGVTRIVGSKVFVYFEGDRALLERQVRAGIAQLVLDQMMYGGSWKEMMKNSTLLNLPEWFMKGAAAYAAGPMDPQRAALLRDGVLSGRFDKFNRLQGDQAELAGHGIWAYVAEVYGPSVIPNILYMTRVSRSVESGFLFVLGVSLKTLSQDVLGYYKDRFGNEERMRQAFALEDLKVRTRTARNYSQFKVSPDGRHAAWVSNELGQYKVWLKDLGTGKVRRILKGEHKLNRIIDRSHPVLAWHPRSQALAIAVERKGELLLRTYTLDDGRMTTRPVFMLEKILTMRYSPDGMKMIFSGVLEGRTDLFLYHVVGNRQEQLTNDLFDDLDPVFINGGDAILFSSDRTDDTLRVINLASADGSAYPKAGQKDLFRFDLNSRSNVLLRLTETPDVDERQPAPYVDGRFTYLSDQAGLVDRYALSFDSVISHVDTTIHYRYVVRTERISDWNRSILEHDVDPAGERFSQLVYVKGKYRFQQGVTRTTADLGEGPRSSEGNERRDTPGGGAVTDDFSPVIKVDRPVPPLEPDAVDIRDYQFSDEPARPADRRTDRGGGRSPVPVPVVVIPAPVPSDTTASKPMVFPQQRNYNVNFTTDQVLTQLDNNYSNQFYQALAGPANLNPGLSGLMQMAISDLFEDHKVVGGLRLALDLNNNTYMLSYANLKRRMDRKVTVQRQALQGISDQGVVKLVTHMAAYQMSWPFSELASVRGSLLYRHDRYVLQSTDIQTLTAPDVNDQMVGLKAEYVFDSSVPRGLNLWTGWKVKFFAEYYQQPDEGRSDMQVVGMDLRHSLRVHRDIVWVNRFAESSSLGNRKVVFFLGGVDNWLFAKVDEEMPIDPSQNYRYQALGSPMRGFFYNARNGSSFAVFNSELRVPLFRYLMNRPIRSDFFQHFQVIFFGDAGTAWTGPSPYSAENSFNRQVIFRNPLTITINNQREPIVGSYGFGLRARLLGYFMRADWAWGIDDGVRLPSVFHFSLALDI
ncbi:MAG: PD40 domain-containing protein [Flavobacteriales bacterium]|nr:PD40 domain-containing protein [Flavobacteriales bacterium]